MSEIKNKNILNIILIFSIFALLAAYFIQYILGHQPCNLCLIERIPYGLCIILIVLNYMIKIDKKFLILLLILTFIFSFMISAYHFGIEKGFLEESTICAIRNTTEIISKEELLKELQTKTISCKDVTFRIFGFSLTTINIIISLIIVILLSKILINYEKFKD